MPPFVKKYGPYALLAAFVFWNAYQYGLPIERDSSHWGRMVIAGLTVGLVFAYSITSRLSEEVRRAPMHIIRGSMLTVAIFGVFNYYQYDRKVWEGLGDSSDITYYYVNSKYLPELGYFSLYSAMLLADREHKDRHSSKIRQYRDLRDYELKSVKFAYQHGEEIKNNQFTPERWTEFQHDVDWFLKRMSTRSMSKNFYPDHGYNPPPTWSVPGSFLANLAPVENVKSVARVDVYLMAAAFIGIAWAFGFDTMLFALLFFVCTFSGRWPILGEALLRFDWVSALVLCMCCLKKQRFGIAGALLAYAGMNRIFPMVFFWGWGAVALYDTIRHRRLLPKHIRFAGGASLTGAILVVLALVQFGPQTFKDSAHNLSMHNRSYSSYRVGLGDLMLFRGEKTRTEQKKDTYQIPGGKLLKGIAAKERKIQDMQPLLRMAAVASVIFLTLYGWRAKREEAWWLLPLAVLPFYCATNAQINYYNLRLVLIIWHGYHVATKGRDLFFHQLGLLLLFVCEAATQGAYLTPFDPEKPELLVARYYVTCTTSIWLAVYLVVVVAKLVKEGWIDTAQKEGAETAPA